MAIAYASWVSETGTLTGTDPTYTLPNTATTGSGNQYLRTVGAAFTAATDIVLTISNSSGAETSVWSFTPGTGGAAGTITRSQLIESTTGSAINWSSATVTLECANPTPVQASAGSSDAGRGIFLDSNGLIDRQMLDQFRIFAQMDFGTSSPTLPSGAATIPFNNIVQQRLPAGASGGFNTTTNTYVAPEAGVYDIFALVTAGTGTASYDLSISAKNNGNLISILAKNPSGIAFVGSVKTILAAGDAVTITSYAGASTPLNQSPYNSSGYQNFTIIKLGS